MKKSIIISIIMMLLLVVLGGSVDAATFSVKASSNSVSVGEKINVTVTFGENASAVQFMLNYDSNKYEYIGKTSGGIYSAATKKFAYTSDDGINADLGNVTFTFKAKVTGHANFSISGAKIATASNTTKHEPGIANASISVTATKEESKPSEGGNSSNNNKPSNSNNSGNSSSNKKNNTSNTNKTSSSTTNTVNSENQTNEEETNGEEVENKVEEEQQEEKGEEVEKTEETATTSGDVQEEEKGFSKIFSNFFKWIGDNKKNIILYCLAIIVIIETILIILMIKSRK